MTKKQPMKFQLLNTKLFLMTKVKCNVIGLNGMVHYMIQVRFIILNMMIMVILQQFKN